MLTELEAATVTEFHVKVAAGWLDVVEASRGNPALSFAACYSALNSLFTLNAKLQKGAGARTGTLFTEDELVKVRRALDEVADPELRSRAFEGIHKATNEQGRLKELVSKFDRETLLFVLSAPDPLEFFANRAIRKVSSHGLVDDEEPGASYKTALANADAPPRARCHAYAGVLYLIRCNLVHGGKIPGGVDDEILSHGLVPLLAMTRSAFELFRPQNGTSSSSS